MRLPEAKQLIQKALEFAPGRSVHQRQPGLGRIPHGQQGRGAAHPARAAYKARPDAEIAAHLGEVLWSLGQRDRAQAIWREGLLLNSENETLQETLKRLRVKP